ncbi:MAG: hypothetical protein A2096_06940 [Spirochaetes bacterium GWF1_41_5]|nr:MAG: hypothetical protein A2096_06940 [Spirochaetes bacterium GWF1_41_5]HBE04422.1 hypothetical protein [Spirochaetia bacterium]
MIYILIAVFLILFIYFNTAEIPCPPCPVLAPTLPGAEPFFMSSDNNKAVLFIHGIPGTPAELREMAEYFKEAGYNCCGPLLPGFGIDERHLNKSRFSDWYGFLRKTYLELYHKYNEVNIIGLSMGGALTLALAEEFSFSRPPHTVVSMAAPICLNGFLGNTFVLQDGRLLFSGITARILPLIKKKQARAEVLAAEPWIGLKEYHSTRAVHSLVHNLPAVKNRLGRISVPALIMHAPGDRDVPYANSIYIYKKIKSPVKKHFPVAYPDNDPTHRHLFPINRHIKYNIFRQALAFINNPENLNSEI